jgi:hypothetical protein
MDDAVDAHAEPPELEDHGEDEDVVVTPATASAGASPPQAMSEEDEDQPLPKRPSASPPVDQVLPSPTDLSKHFKSCRSATGSCTSSRT